MTLAIFAPAEAQPHHNTRHEWGELAGLAPEVVLPTEELDRVKRQGPIGSKCSLLFKDIIEKSRGEVSPMFLIDVAHFDVSKTYKIL